MLRILGRAVGGLAAGVAGTVAMGGASFLMRRLVEPGAPVSKTHYESVVEWVADRVGGASGDREPAAAMDPATRIRLGEAAHLGFGAFWGLVFAILFRNRAVNPIANGVAGGTMLWVGAFEGYMPALGMTKSIREMDSYERSRTLICHLTYAITTFTFLRAFSKN